MKADHKGLVREAIKAAITAAGGTQMNLAEKLGGSYSQQQISYWLRVGKVPAEHVPLIERVTGVSRHQLCPMVFGEPADSKSMNKAAA